MKNSQVDIWPKKIVVLLLNDKRSLAHSTLWMFAIAREI